MHRWLDRAIVALAFASVLVFAISMANGVTAAVHGALTVIDLLIVGAYAVVFLMKGLLDEQPLRWFRRHAWLAIALLPLTIPFLVAQPWFLGVQVLILMVRAGKAMDRALHLRIVHGVHERYRARLAEEISQPLLLNLANVLEAAVVSRDFASTFGRSLHERRDLVEAAVRRGIEASPRIATFARLQPVQRFIDDTTCEVVDAVHATLSSPEMNALLQESFRDAFRELKEGIAEPRWQQKGISVTEAAHRVAEAAHLARPAPAAQVATAAVVVPR